MNMEFPQKALPPAMVRFGSECAHPNDAICL